jgi:hypothetical protein
MTGGSADPVSLSWLSELAIQDQVALLRYPRRTISGEVAGHIADVVGGYAVIQHLHGPSDRWNLSEPLARHLERVLDKLHLWWNSASLTSSERKYLIEHRADRELPPHTVRVERPVIRAYLEIRARETPPL